MFSDLRKLVRPRSAVLIGASERASSVGGLALANMVEHSQFAGGVFLVNPNRSEIGGRPCFPNVTALPEMPDVAVVTVPAVFVLPALEECAAKGIPFAVVLTSGFGETGEAGRQLEARMRSLAERTGMRIYGPNCPGLTNITDRLGLTFSPAFRHDLKGGSIGLATQGGGLGRGVLQAMSRGLGFGFWASTGNEADLQVADFINYMADAPDITIIAALLEGIKDGPRFIAAVARAVENGKPVIVLKLGRSEYGAKAAASHTASITGSAEVNSAALRQLGAIEVDDIDEMIDLASLFARRLPTPAERIAVYGDSGGACVLTADFLGMAGVRLAEITPDIRAGLAALLPDYASLDNPVDTTAATITDPSLLEETLTILCDDPAVTLVLAPLALDYGEATLIKANKMAAAQQRGRATVVPVWMSDRLGPGYGRLVDAGLIPIRSARNAATALRRYADWGARRSVGQVARQPAYVCSPVAPRMLTEAEGKAWLESAGLPVPKSAVARTADEAVIAAGAAGYPVVLKVVSLDIVHKSDIGGVVLNLLDGQAVRQAFERISASVALAAPEARVEGMLVEWMAPAHGLEMLVGVSRDPVFGLVMTFGLGGIHVELFKDVTRRLLPIDREAAARMLQEIKAYPLLTGARGAAPLDTDALCHFIADFSDFLMTNAATIEGAELNPVWVGPQGSGVCVLDAFITARL